MNDTNDILDFYRQVHSELCALSAQGHGDADSTALLDYEATNNELEAVLGGCSEDSSNNDKET